MLTTIKVLVNNHTTVWGSWYDPSTSTWGYACCQSIIHASYCAGEAGIEAARASDARNMLSSAASTSAVTDQRGESGDGRERNGHKSVKRGGEVAFDQDRIAQAINDDKKRKMRGDDGDEKFGTKKQKIPEIGSVDITEEELGRFIQLFDTGFMLTGSQRHIG
jgi:pre-mRNA-processing factor SLU7